MNKTLLDTDIFSEILKKKNQNVIERASVYYRIFESYTISIFTVIEIIKGFSKIERPDKERDFLSALPEWEVLDIDLECSKLAGHIYAGLEKTGSPIGSFDVLIASIALRHNLSLTTGNTKHYKQIIEIGYPLVLDNWKK